jgi:plastocyanin
MRRGLSTLLFAAAVLNLWALPAGPLAQEPVLQITAPRAARVGEDVTLTLAAPPVTAVRYEWGVGDETAESRQPTFTTRFPVVGAATVSVQAFDVSGGRIGTDRVTVNVRTAATKETPKPKADPKPTRRARHRARPRPRVIAAASSSVTIKDFSFGPSSITVQVGDTVSWANQGNQPHTATAGDGSFDTGRLSRGQSGSHTFTSAGTFSYICSIHPFMKGTVVVAGAGGGSSGGSSSGGSSGGGSAGATGSGSAPAAPAQSSGGLPSTGLDLDWLLLSGALLIASGLLVRRAAR